MIRGLFCFFRVTAHYRSMRSPFPINAAFTLILLLISLVCKAQPGKTKNIIGADLTTGAYKRYYSVSYERYFNKLAVQLAFGKSSNAGSATAYTTSWTGVAYPVDFSYRLNYMIMNRYSISGQVNIGAWALKPGVYAALDARYLDMNVHRLSHDPNCLYYDVGCESDVHSKIISLGPQVGLKTRIAKMLVLHISAAYPFYFPVDNKTTMFLNNYFERSRQTPYLGGALELNTGIGISF